ncbi:hypothetical protein XENOCAPTIV_013653 [Xenoophorus captivus]|uniref:Uncharacterized protein n=2 Tax=Goodeidae TaxID=28758 RepID=A0ABV0RQG6_9TELE
MLAFTRMRFKLSAINVSTFQQYLLLRLHEGRKVGGTQKTDNEAWERDFPKVFHHTNIHPHSSWVSVHFGDLKQANDIHLSSGTVNKRKSGERVLGLGTCSPAGRGQCNAGRAGVSCQRE